MTAEHSVAILARVRPALLSNTVELSRRLLPDIFCHIVDGLEDIKIFYFVSGNLHLGHVGRDIIRVISSFEGVEGMQVLLGIGTNYRPVRNWEFVRVETYEIGRDCSFEEICQEAVKSAKASSAEILHFGQLLNGREILVVSSFDPAKWDFTNNYLRNHPDLVLGLSVICP